MRASISAEDLDAVIDKAAEELFQTVRDLIELDSRIPPDGDESAVAEFVSGLLERAGLGIPDRIEFAPGRTNLVLRIRGAGGGPNLALCGHLDTKPFGESDTAWHTDPLVATYEGDRLYGLGSSDMKAAIAAMVYAARAILVDLDTKLLGDLILIFTADEEAGSVFGARRLLTELDGIDACLIGEPSGLEEELDRIHVASRGFAAFLITVQGLPMHSSLAHRSGAPNAVLTAARLMLELPTALVLDHVPHPSDGSGPIITVGAVVSGGSGFGTNPGFAEFGVEVRTVPGMRRPDLYAAIGRWVASCSVEHPGVKVGFHPVDGLEWIEPTEIPPTHPLVVGLRKAARGVLSRDPRLGTFPGGTDAPWFEARGIPTIPSFGPGLLRVAHGPNEYVQLTSVLLACKIYARMVLDYCQSAAERTT